MWLIKTIKFFLTIFVFVFVVAAIAGFGAAIYFYPIYSKDLPDIRVLNDFNYKSVNKIMTEDGVLMAEYYDERRYPVDLSEVPDLIENAFLAAEDAEFYDHKGLDFVSIMRALYIDLTTGSAKQGASTITQQVVKSLLLSPEKTYERKIKEAILAYRLENTLSKRDILSLYLNQIFFGRNAYGIKAAAQIYFGKELRDITLEEAAFLACLPKAPSTYSNPKNWEKALDRTKYVINQMFKNDFITSDQKKNAYEKAENLTFYNAETSTFKALPYYSSEVIKYLKELEEEKPDLAILKDGGYTVITAANYQAGVLAQRAVRDNLRAVDKRRGWRGPLQEFKKELYPGPEESEELAYGLNPIFLAKVTKMLVSAVEVDVLSLEDAPISAKIDFEQSKWARKYLKKDIVRGKIKESIRWISPLANLKLGDVIEVSLKADCNYKTSKDCFILDQTPEVQSALVSIDAVLGEVKAIQGGYDYKRSVFNRAMQGKRQPGSSFKPFVYLSAIEKLGYHPATLVPDSYFEILAGNGEIWAPKNYDRNFLGNITLRTALERSRNVVSAYITNEVGIDTVIETARRMGITTYIPREYSISLGSAETIPFEMVRAYGVFANHGRLADTILVKEIIDRNGNIVFRKSPSYKQVVGEKEAFLMANMMRGVVEHGTAQRIKKLGRPVAGKTGTTNEQMDAWFIGYTPGWATGVWVGFDVKFPLGKGETGGRAAAPAFLKYMKGFLSDKPIIDFDIPSGVVPRYINKSRGTYSNDTKSGFLEYFIMGNDRLDGDISEIIKKQTSSSANYLENDDF